MSAKRLVITEKKVKKILATIDAGLSVGMGDPKPGHMCVEAAVCYGLGLPHSDSPSCVDPFIRNIKISLNDLFCTWKSRQDRANGLRRLGLVQLGSEGHFDVRQFNRLFNTMLLKHYPDLYHYRLGQEDQFDDELLANFLMTATGYGTDLVQRSRATHILCEHFVQIFVKMKLPGVKWLKLAPLPKNKRSVKK